MTYQPALIPPDDPPRRTRPRRDPTIGVDIRRMTEAQFQAWVMARATRAGWQICFVRRSIVKRGGHTSWVTNTSHKGWPDLVLWRPPRLVFLELKSMSGTASPEQKRTIADLNACGGDDVEAYIVRPSDADELLHLLARPRVK